MTKNAARAFLFAILLVSIFGFTHGALWAASAQSGFDFDVSLNGYSISLAPNHSGYVQVAVNLVSGSPQNVTLTSTVSPQNGQLSTSFAPQSWGYPSFVATLIVSALGATPGKHYSVTVTGVAGGLVKDAPLLTVTISCPQGTCATLTTAGVGNGMVDPLCPSGCSEPIGQTVNVTAVPAPSWTFSGWNVTGVACSNGISSNPCIFTMPNGPVSVTANFVQYQQTLYTSYTGQGSLSPSCPTGCQIAIGSQVSVIANPSPGWVVSGYHLTNGVSCGAELGYTCSFTMPNFPVSFQVTFAETTTTTQVIVVVTSTIRTSVTSVSVVASSTTSTVSVTTVSVSAIGTTTTSINLSTTSSFVTQTVPNLATQFSTVSTNATSVTTALQNPPLELTVAGIILFSALMIGINAIRRSGHRGTVRCARCGFNNPSARKYCANCGESLKGG